jgi:hypothetical protein
MPATVELVREYGHAGSTITPETLVAMKRNQATAGGEQLECLGQGEVRLGRPVGGPEERGVHRASLRRYELRTRRGFARRPGHGSRLRQSTDSPIAGQRISLIANQRQPRWDFDGVGATFVHTETEGM